MIFFKNTEITENVIQFEALEGDKCLGSCIMALNKSADIVSVSDYTDIFIAQGLVRSALNYATLRDIYMTVFSDESTFNIAKAMNYEFIDGKYVKDIPSVLMGSCCSGKE